MLAIPLPLCAIDPPKRFSEAHKKLDSWFACAEFWCERQCIHPTRRVEVAVSPLNVTNVAKARSLRIIDTPTIEEFNTPFKSFLVCNESKSAFSARLINLAQRGDEPTPIFGSRVLKLVISAYSELEFRGRQRLAIIFLQVCSSTTTLVKTFAFGHWHLGTTDLHGTS